MTASLGSPALVSTPGRADLLAELERLSQGRGLTYDERRFLSAGAPDRAFVERRLTDLARAQVWQPAVIGAVALLGFAMIWAASSGVPSASWLMVLPALATPFLKYRQIARRIEIYRALHALADAPASGATA